jgi:hypothetical protein
VDTVLVSGAVSTTVVVTAVVVDDDSGDAPEHG